MGNQSLSDSPCVSALAVGATESDRAELEEIFRDCGWKIGWARTRSEARKFMEATPVRVVISDREVPEGGWLEMLDDLMQRSEPPALLVTSRLADDSFWAEVLNRGAYDVLAQPLDREEVVRLVGAAARHVDNERQRRQPQIAKPLVLAAAS